MDKHDKQQLSELLKFREGYAGMAHIKDLKEDGSTFKNVRMPNSGKFGIYFDQDGHATTMYGELLTPQGKSYTSIEDAMSDIVSSKKYQSLLNMDIDPFNPSKEQSLELKTKRIDQGVSEWDNYLRKDVNGRQWEEFTAGQQAALVSANFQIGLVSKMTHNSGSWGNTIKALGNRDSNLQQFSNNLVNWKWNKDTPRRVEDFQDMFNGTSLRGKGLPAERIFNFNKVNEIKQPSVIEDTNVIEDIFDTLEAIDTIVPIMSEVEESYMPPKPIESDVLADLLPNEPYLAPVEVAKPMGVSEPELEEIPVEEEAAKSEVDITRFGGQPDIDQTSVLDAISSITTKGMGKDFGNKIMENTSIGMVMQPMSRAFLSNDQIDPNYDPREEPELFNELTADLKPEQLEDLSDYTGNRHDFVMAATSFNAQNKRYAEMKRYTQDHPVLSGVNTVTSILGDAVMFSPVSTVIAAKGVAMTGANIMRMSKAAKFTTYGAAEMAEQGAQEIIWSKYNQDYKFDPTLFGFSVLAGVGVKNMLHNQNVDNYLKHMMNNEEGFINLSTAEGKRMVDVVAANVDSEQAIALAKRVEELKTVTANRVRKTIVADKDRLAKHLEDTRANYKSAEKGTKDAKQYKSRVQKLQRQLKKMEANEVNQLKMLVDGTHPKLLSKLNPELSAKTIAKELGIAPELVSTPKKVRQFLGLDNADIADGFVIDGDKAYTGVVNAQVKEMKTNMRNNMNETMKYAADKVGDNFVGNALHDFASVDGAMSRYLFNKGNLVSSDNPLVSSFYNWMAPDGMGRQGASKIRAIESQQKYSDMFGGELMNSFHGVGDELYSHIKKVNVTAGKAMSTFNVDDYEDTVMGIFRNRLLLGADKFDEVTADKDIVKLANKFADKYNATNDSIVKRMKNAGVQGVDFDSTEDFMHRQWDYKKARGVSDADLDAAIYKGMMQYAEKTGGQIDAKLLAKEAKKFSFGIRNADISKVEDAQSNYIKMLSNLAEKTEGAEAKKVLTDEASRLAMVQAQKEMGDLANRTKLDVNVKIGNTNLSLSDLLETNFITTQKRYNSRMAARIASAEHGMKNIDDIGEWIDDAVTTEIKRLADSGVENPASKVSHIEDSMRSDFKSFKQGYMSGLKDMSSQDDNNFVRFISKMNFAALMQYVGISSIAEFGGTIVEAGVRTTMREFSESIIPHLKDMYLKRPTKFARAIDEELMSITGIGLEDYAFSTRGVSKGERIFKEGAMSGVEKVIDVTARTTQGVFGPIEVISRRMTRNSLTQKWAQHFAGETSPDGILTAFFGKQGNISNRVMENTNLGAFDEAGEFVFNKNYDRIKKSFNDFAEYNEHGNVTKLNLDKWNVDTANSFGDVLQMQASHILVNPDATTQALWQTSTIGRIINQFRTFGINAATKVGGYTLANAASGLRHGDSVELQKASARIFMGSTLGMLAVTARENIKTLGDGEGFNSDLFDEGMMKAAAIGFSRSSMITNFDIFSDTIGGAFGFDPIFEKSSSIGRSKNMFNLSTSPTGQAMSGGVEGLTDIMQGEFKKGGLRLLRTSPFQRQILLQQIMNYSQKED